VQLVFLDTPLLAPEEQRLSVLEEMEVGHQTYVDLMNYDNEREAIELLKNEQLTWLNQTLAASKAHWLIVMGHFPMYSGGEHGNTPELIQDIKPLLDKYNVDAYLCGHDHTLQHLSQDKVEYFVSGGGTYRGTYTAIKQSKFGTIIPGFMVHQITATNMTTTLIDRDGKEVHRHTQLPRHK
jgi:acid phosphatase